MPYAPFDPTRAVTFDLSNGQVHLDNASVRVFVPADAIASLCQSAGEEASRTLGKAMGVAMGLRLSRRLSDQPDADPPRVASVGIEAFIEHLAGEFAIAGLGAVGMERWGKALVFVVDHATLPATVVAGALEGAIECATGRHATCELIMQSQARSRWLVANAQAVTKVRGWLGEGVSWGEALVKLHASDDTPARGDA